MDISDGYTVPNQDLSRGKSQKDEYHEYADLNSATSASNVPCQIGEDGYLVPESLSLNTGSEVYYSTSIKQKEDRNTKVDVEDEINEYIDFE